jgi:hypothetical protein
VLNSSLDSRIGGTALQKKSVVLGDRWLLEKVLTNEVPALEVEAVQLVASHLGIHYVLIDNEYCAFRVPEDSRC